MTTAPAQLVVVMCAFPNIEDAGEAAHILVSDDLAACVNIVRDVRSIYRWNSSEVLCFIKTQKSRHAELLERLKELHPYEVPELVTLEPSHVNDSYLRWVIDETTPGRGAPRVEGDAE
jgi:periplasmic divalent cation tolerance protein